MLAQTKHRLSKLVQIARAPASWTFSNARRQEKSESLGAIKSQLQQKTDELQIQFTELGDAFRSQALLASQLMKEGRHEDDASSDENGSETLFEQAFALIESSIEIVLETAARNTRLIEFFDEYEDKFDDVRRGETKLAKTLLPIQIIERLFRIEAANLPPELQAAFTSLTKDISYLHSEMRKTLENEFSSLKQTAESIEDTRDKLFQDADYLSRQARRSKARITKALEEVRLNFEKTSESQKLLAQAAIDIANESSNVLVGMQFGDAMRQRCDHIIEALDEASQTFAKNGNTQDSLRICKLQANQLYAIDSDFKQASSQIQQGIWQMSRSIDQVNANCMPIGNIEHSVEAIEKIYATLLDAIDDVRHLTNLALAGAQKTYDASASFDGTASYVTKTLKDLACGIKVIALNAQIQAAQLGEGTGLEVLSSHTCNISDETDRFTTQIGSELDTLVVLLDEVIKHCDLIKNDADAQIHKLDTEGSEIRDRLEQQCAAQTANIRLVANMLQECKQNTDRLRRLPLVTSTPQPQFSIVRDKLETFVENAAPSGKLTASKHAAAALTLDQNYTMDSERLIHEAFLEGKETSDDELITAGYGSSKNEDNITLF